MPVDVTYQDLKLRLNPYDNTIENKMLLSSSIREYAELQFMKNANNGGAFIDIGANVGYYSLMAAKMGYAKILSFEPNKIVYERFLQNIKFNDFESAISFHPIGIGAENCQMELGLGQGDLGSSSIHLDESKSTKKVTINIMPLANILAQEKIDKIDALKIDIEGMEDMALMPYFKQAPINQWPKIIIIEDNAPLWSTNIIEWLTQNGYAIHGKTKGNLLLQKLGRA